MAKSTIATIWLDQMSSTAATVATTMHLSLCKIDPYLMRFSSSDRCFDYITHINQIDTQIILIISCDSTNDLPYSLLKRCDESPRISAVHAFSFTQGATICSEVLSNTTKMHGPYTDISELCNQLKQLPYIKKEV